MRQGVGRLICVGGNKEKMNSDAVQLYLLVLVIHIRAE